MGKLVLHLPDGSTRDIPLARERMTIGRRVDNDICLPLPTVSGEHAAVVTVLDDSFLEDLGSRNGTLVNGKEIRKHFLRDHDEIDIGRQRLVYFSGVFESSEPAAASHAGHREPAPSPRPVARFGDEPREEGVEALASLDEPVPQDGLIDTAVLLGMTPAPDEPPPVPAGGRPCFEILDGPNAGVSVTIERDRFVLGRVGEQVAEVERTADGLRVMLLEGDTAPAINGAPLPREGALLSRGDELVVAGVRLRFAETGDPAGSQRNR
jgi:hypothetical protein